MRKAIGLVSVVILLTYGTWVYLPPVRESTVVMYRTPDLARPGLAEDRIPNSPSSVYAIEGELRLCLCHLSQHKQFAFHPRQKELANYTEVVLLLEHLNSLRINSPTLTAARLTDDLGQKYDGQLVQTRDGNSSMPGSTVQYTLRFPPLNPYASLVILNVTIGDAVFELNGAALP